VAVIDWKNIDWAGMQDATIARRVGRSRERVRQVRLRLGAPPAAWGRSGKPDDLAAAVARLREDAALRRDVVAGVLTREALSLALGCSFHLACRACRCVGLRVRTSRLAGRWAAMRQAADWRLGNLALARIWGASPQVVASMRLNWHKRRPLWRSGLEPAAVVAAERAKTCTSSDSKPRT